MGRATRPSPGRSTAASPPRRGAAQAEPHQDRPAQRRAARVRRGALLDVARADPRTEPPSENEQSSASPERNRLGASRLVARMGRRARAATARGSTPAISRRASASAAAGGTTPDRHRRASGRARQRRPLPRETAARRSIRPNPSAPLSCMERDSRSVTSAFHGCRSAAGPIARWRILALARRRRLLDARETSRSKAAR
jgi:hypothetical protein